MALRCREKRHLRMICGLANGGMAIRCLGMRTRPAVLVVAALFAAFTITTQPSAQADTFGTSGNEFTIDFVPIGNAGNAANTTGFGAVPYEYRMGTYEVSQNAIDKATASGMANVTAGAWTGNQPAANISWYEAAAFVNWLNTSTGNTAAYDLAWDGSAWSMNPWSSGQAWAPGGENLYRNKAAYYFLPSDNEWVKAAYYNPAGSSYFLYPTASDSAPTAVASGTDAGTAVYGQPLEQGPAGVDVAGALSPYGTMGQGGNVFEWNESAFDGPNSSSSEDRRVRGGGWDLHPEPEWWNLSEDWDMPHKEWILSDSASMPVFRLPSGDGIDLGFRVASVPEPSTYALLLMTGAGALWWARRRQ